MALLDAKVKAAKVPEGKNGSSSLMVVAFTF